MCPSCTAELQQVLDTALKTGPDMFAEYALYPSQPLALSVCVCGR
jgi:hypothetical protein